LTTDPTLDHLSREELIVRARALGARRPEVMTRVELRDEIVRLGESDPSVRRRTRGWLGVARDLVASVVDSGLNLPGAAAAIRGEGKPEHEWQGPPPVATVTLAEIYLAQGHTDRALSVLAEVLANEPDHPAALALRDRIERRGEPHRVPVAPRVADLEELTPGRPISVTAPEIRAGLDVAAPAPSESVAPPSEPMAAPSEPAAASSEPVAAPSESVAPPSEVPPHPFPDEPSPITSEHAPYPDPVRHSEPVIYPEEQTVRGVVNLFPDQPACAIIVTPRGVEAFYELPVSATGALLRLVWFTPAPGGVERGERDLPVEPGYHRVPIEALPASTEVRAALGVIGAEGFAPLAVAWVYRRGAGAPVLAFAPPGEEPPTLRARVEARVVALG
jgi:hypothetical protein